MTTVKIAVSSRALFQLEEEHQVFEKDGLEAYVKIQQDRKNTALQTGVAYPFIKVIAFVNEELKQKGCEARFEVALLSHNHGGTAVRLINSIIDKNLPIKQMGLTGGEDPVRYLAGLGIDLFLTLYEDDVKSALKKGHAAALMSQQEMADVEKHQLRIAFDLDAVLFGDESEKKYQELKAEDPSTAVERYECYERQMADQPLSEGPLKKFAEAIGNIQRDFDERTKDEKPRPPCPIRTYIVTARGVIAGKRALHTLEAWKLTVNETFFLSGQSKAGILKEIRPHIFFDDTRKNIVDAQKVGVPSGEVKADA